MHKDLLVLVGLNRDLQLSLRNAVPDAVIEVFDEVAVAWSAAHTRPGVAVVSLEGELETAFRLVSALAEGGTRVVVLGSKKDADLILRAMREGAHEFVLSSDAERLGQAIREQLQPVRTAALGSVVTVFPAKGGVGATTLAANLAGCWSKDKKRVCILDLNLTMGDVAGFLDLTGGYAISDVLGNLGRLDRELLDASLLHHRSGVAVLAQCDKIEEADRVDPKLMHALLRLLRQHYDAVVVDGLRNFDDVALAVLDASDRILLVCTEEVPAVRDAHRCADILKRLGNDEPKLKLVVNRYQRSAVMTEGLIAETTGMGISARVANNYQAVVRAVERGALLVDDAPNAEITRDVAGMYAMLTATPRPAAPERPSVFARLFAFRTATHGAR